MSHAAREVEQPLWAIMAAATSPLTLTDLQRRSGASRKAIQHRLTCWTNAGLAARINSIGFMLTDSAERRAAPPRTTYNGEIHARERTDRDRLWAAMRVLRSFDAPALRMASSATERSVSNYLNVLQRAGYVRMTRRGSAKAGTWATYVLLRNTGRHCPQISHHRALDGSSRCELVDRNIGARIDISPGAVSLTRKRRAAAASGGEG